MTFRFVLVLCLFLIAPLSSLWAQQASVEPLEIGPSGEAYLKATRFRGIDSDVAYFDPTRPAPRLDTSEQPRSDRERSDLERDINRGLWSNARIITVLLTGLVIATILYLFVKFGGAGSVSFSGTPEDAQRRRAGRGGKNGSKGGTPKSLQAILNMRDRREALVALSHHLIAKVITAQGVLLQRSWTARDAMRRVPRDFDHREALQNLVLDSERVQFGGRDVSEDEFRAHVDALRPLYATGSQ